VVTAAVALGAFWSALWAYSYRSITSLLAIGKAGGPATIAVHHDLRHVFLFAGEGHDGRFFYTIARYPFDIALLNRRIPITGYRYRRILYPLLAGRLAPHGGIPLIFAFLGLSLVGIGIGAYSLTRFPRSPHWLPLIVAIDPGVIVAVWISLADALATGLVLAAFAAMFRKRWALATVVLVLACLTRETTVLVALCMYFWPKVPMRTRAMVALIPTAVLGCWALYVSHITHTALSAAPVNGSLTYPFGGWSHGTQGPVDALISGVVVILLVAAVVSRRRVPLPVILYIAATIVMLMCSEVAVTNQWIDATRSVAPAVPLAAWVLCQPRARRAGAKAARGDERSAGELTRPRAAPV
jgi:hypothetical protein